jgi:hypothetical protein
MTVPRRRPLMSTLTKRITLVAGTGAFVFALALPAARADETVIEKRVEESHSYKVEQPAPPAVVERRTTVEAVPAAPGEVVTEHKTVERVPPPAVVEKHTTVETVPAAPVIERRTTETIHTDD